MSSHEPIHSGHFMTSNPHTEPQPDEDEDVDVVDVEVEDDEKTPEDQISVSKKAELYEKPVTFYKFGPRKTQSIAIDVSLNKLNKCIKVAYNKMTTPKWKDFKGLRLHWKQRIRLNNVIWRAYYMEFRKPDRQPTTSTVIEKPKRRTPYCYFSVPDDDNTHAKLEGSLIEGMYWKRKMEAVSAQYKRWRHFMKNRRGGSRRRREQSGQNRSAFPFVFDSMQVPIQRSQTPKNMSTDYFDADDLENVFTDELFASLNRPYMFPPRDMLQSNNADIMQPGLLSLQPSLEEIMNSLDGSPSGTSSAPPPNLTHTNQQTMCGGQQQPPPPQQQQSLPSRSHQTQEFHQFIAPAPPNQGSMVIQSRHQPPQPQPSRSIDYSMKDYVAANMLLDYSNQPINTSPQPTRQSSAITSHMLMMSAGLGSQPQYSQATQYDQRTWKSSMNMNSFLVTGGDVVSNMDYMPQFLSPGNRLYQSSLNMNTQNTSNMTWTRSTSVPQNSWLEQQLASSPLPLQSPSPLSSPLSNHSQGPPPPSLGLSGPPISTPTSSLGIARPAPPSATIHPNVSIRSPVLRQNDPPKQIVNPLVPSLPLHSQETLADRLGRPSLASTVTQSLPNSVQIRKSSDSQMPPQNNQIMKSGGKMSTEWPSPSTSSSEGQRSAPTSARILTDEKNPWMNMLQQGPSPSVEPSFPSSSRSSHSPHSFEMKTEVKEYPSGVQGRPQSRQVPADSTLQPSERKRILHLHAEQNRRSALKDGFDQLMDMIPDLYSGGVKPTNAVVLAKASEHIRSLQSQRDKNEQMKAALEAKMQALNSKITTLQSSLPSGSSTHSSNDVDMPSKVMQFAERYMKERSREEWHFWVLTKMLDPMIRSFASNIHPDPSDRNELSITAAQWFSEHWKVHELRPLSSNILVYLATNTRVLSDPSSLQQHVAEQLGKQEPM